MHNGVAMNLFLLYITMSIYVILLWVVWDKNKNMSLFDQSGMENTFVLFLCRPISLVLWTHKISLHKSNLCSPQTDQILTSSSILLHLLV